MALLAWAPALFVTSEQVTLTTSYPSPAGIYRRLITTGGTAGSPEHTVLARDAGNVGVGTTLPAALLDVDGELRVGSSGAACSSANAGSLRYVQALKRLEYCDGAQWKSQAGVGRVKVTAYWHPANTSTCLSQWAFLTKNPREICEAEGYRDFSGSCFAPAICVSAAVGSISSNTAAPGGPGKWVTSCIGNNGYQTMNDQTEILCVN